MKKAIAIIVLGLLWCNAAFSAEFKHKRIECAFDVFGGTKGPKQERYWNYFFILDERKKNAKLFRLANGYIHETIDLNFVASVKMIQFTSRDFALKKSEFYYLDRESGIMSYMGDKKDSDFVTAECKPFADDLDPEWYLINAALENRKKQMEKNIF